MLGLGKKQINYTDDENLVISKKLMPWGKVDVYKNRVVIFGALGVSSKTIPIKNIGNISFGRISQKVKIETAGGQKYDFTVSGKAEEIIKAIENLL
jgi:hypothetical protein